MGRALDKIVGIVNGYAREYDVSLTSGDESRLKALGRSLDAGSMTADQAKDAIVDELNKKSRRDISRDDAKSLGKELDKLTH